MTKEEIINAFEQTLGCSIKEAVKKIDEASKAAAEKRVADEESKS